MGDVLIPLLIAATLAFALWRRVAVYDAFARGAAQGLAAARSILPFLVAMLPALALLQATGALGALADLLAPALERLGLPRSVLPLMLTRPLSGSASLAVLERTLDQVGPDSYPGRVASTLMGSSETVFYTLALYLGAAGVRRARHAAPAALLAWFAGSVAAAWACRIW
ncbi:MAG: spore maturation protein [Oscillospiraceae bacterium]|jgi:spore maturation protein B|nr:spore maturation protein [Oscillospiraceae bacterium]